MVRFRNMLPAAIVDVSGCSQQPTDSADALCGRVSIYSLSIA